MARPLKIAIVVHGRFHAFELARALIEMGQDVAVLTNYPRFAVRQFGLPPSRVRSLPFHSVLARMANRSPRLRQSEAVEYWLHEWFGRWASRCLEGEDWDVVYSWSGISEPILQTPPTHRALRLVVRGSTHIRSQAALLLEEQRRTSMPQEHPSPWRVLREEREYQLADGVVVLSSFCRQTFLDQGFPPGRVHLMISGTRIGSFRPSLEVIDERCHRLHGGEPLRVLNVGTFSYQKGAFDFAEIVRSLDPSRFRFRMVGLVHPEAKALASSLAARVEFVPRMPQAQLPAEYAKADLFLYPTIQDGFPAVVAQAAAGGLPVLVTPTGAGHDVVRDGETGWVLPIRSPERFVEKLLWCDRNREALARMVREAHRSFKVRDWAVVADDFLQICESLGAARQRVAVTARAPSPVMGKLAIVAHGRFYILDLARELIRQGTDLTVLTNYPLRMAKRFGVPREHVRTWLIHGVLSRIAHQLGLARRLEPWLHRSFSRWALRQLRSGEFAGVKCMSGVAEETFRSQGHDSTLKMLARGSSHIEVQSGLLLAEEMRVGARLDRPSRWRVERELREYAMADVVLVLSTFARESFLARGFPEDRLRTLHLGSDARLFRASRGVIEERCRRILSGERLRVLNVGSFAFRKGAFDLVEIARRCRGHMIVRTVGDQPRETSALRKQATGLIEFVRRQPEAMLPVFYAWADVFVFPTIEDGYAVVLAQAQAAGLPILATTNCAASDMLEEGRTGWVLPIREPGAFVARLRWCDEHRPELARMTRDVHESCSQRDWSVVAEEFRAICGGLLGRLDSRRDERSAVAPVAGQSAPGGSGE
jgi:glycosyltransferase involved in cell wall biosynthesis